MSVIADVKGTETVTGYISVGHDTGDLALDLADVQAAFSVSHKRP